MPLATSTRRSSLSDARTVSFPRGDAAAFFSVDNTHKRNMDHNTDNGHDDDESSRNARSVSMQSLPLRARLLKRQRQSVASVTPSTLFNRLQTSSVVLVDCRPFHEYVAGHIRGALWCDGGRRTRHKSVDEVLADSDGACATKLARRDMMEIVVIGGNRSSSSLLYRMDGGYRFAKLLLREERAFSVQFLAAGFHAFARRYPFLLEKSNPIVDNTMSSGTASPLSSVQSLEDEDDGEMLPTDDAPTLKRALSPPQTVQYPNEIIDNFLFLGNFWQANNPRVVSDLGITHIVNMGAMTEDRNRFNRIKYLDVDIKDRETVDIRKEFAHTIAFIRAASRERGARVLIHCVQGVSRSSTIVIWYLMLEMKCTLSAAYSYVLKRRPLIFPNRGFMEQLMENEKNLYGYESVQADELDLLQHGLLPPLDRRGSALRWSQST